jgi:hypothetical protein
MWSFEDANLENSFEIPNGIPIENSLRISIENSFWGYLKYQLKYPFVKFEILKMVVVRSFCFGLNIFSPFGMNRQKRRTREPFCIFSPFGA